MPQETPADMGTKIEIEPFNYIGGDCIKNPKNCLFNETVMNEVKCDGVMVKIGAKATNRLMACM